MRSVVLSKRSARRNRHISVTPEHQPEKTSARSENVANGPLRVHIESLPPRPAPTEEQKAQKTTDDRLRWFLAGIQILTFLGLVAYVCETRRTNNLTEKLVNNSVEAERPWMGAGIVVKDFESGKTPTYAIAFQNSGQRPARVNLTATHSRFYNSFPDEPEFNWDTTPSKSLVVPGQPAVSTWKGLSNDPVRANSMLDSTFYIYGKIEYADILTGKLYWTHLCWRYLPKMRDISNGGFLNCTEYNDAT